MRVPTSVGSEVHQGTPWALHCTGRVHDLPVGRASSRWAQPPGIRDDTYPCLTRVIGQCSCGTALAPTLCVDHPEDPSASLGPGGTTLEREEFRRFLLHAERAGDSSPYSLRAWIDLAEAWRITRALRDCSGNRSAAARALGIGRRTLYSKMERLGIAPSWVP